MKPRIIHLLDDQNVGGVMRWIEAVSDALKDQFDFQLVRSQNLASIRPSDLVIYHNPSSWQRSLTLLQLKRQGNRIILHEHHYCQGFERLNVPAKRRFRAMLRWNYRLVDRVVSISYGQLDWLREHQLVPFTKLEIIPVRANLEHLVDIPEKQLQAPFILGAYGRFTRVKGFDTLLKAMQQIERSKVFLYLGGYGEDEAALKTLAADQPNIKFWGKVTDLRGFLSGCDAIVVPSRWEPGGIACMEAKAAGKPIIVSSTDGLTEQVQDCGILVPPADPAWLVTAIEQMITASPEQLTVWGYNARASVQEDWERHITQWQALLSSFSYVA